jgi:hypothetical protein
MHDVADKIKQRSPNASTGIAAGSSYHSAWIDTVPLADLRRDGKVAMEKLFSEDGRTRDFVKTHAKAGDVVIHFRCGDIVDGGDNTTNWQYGLLPFDWLYRAIPAGSKRVFVAGNFGHIKIKTKHKDIHTTNKPGQMKGDKAKEKTKKTMGTTDEKKCPHLLYGLLRYLKNRARERGEKEGLFEVQFVSDSALSDWLLLANAPTLIASVSTYALTAAWLNEGHVVLPACGLLGLKVGKLTGAEGTRNGVGRGVQGGVGDAGRGDGITVNRGVLETR